MSTSTSDGHTPGPLPEGSLVTVTISVRLPVAATEKQIGEWLNYSLCNSGGCALDNPLVHHDAQAWRHSLEWLDTGDKVWREEYGHEKRDDGAIYYSVRYHRERRAAAAKAEGPDA